MAGFKHKWRFQTLIPHAETLMERNSTRKCGMPDAMFRLADEMFTKASVVYLVVLRGIGDGVFAIYSL